MYRWLVCYFLVCGMLVCCVGCQDSQTVSQKAPSLTLMDSLNRIEKLATRISDGLGDGEMEKAHDPVHRILQMLREAPSQIESIIVGRTGPGETSQLH